VRKISSPPHLIAQAAKLTLEAGQNFGTEMRIGGKNGL
jgi:hypothetical protein